MGIGRNKKELALLEKAYEAEIDYALGGCFTHIIQPKKTKTLQKLVDDGKLERAETVLGGRFPVVISGYVLTHFGRLSYCASCADSVD